MKLALLKCTIWWWFFYPQTCAALTTIFPEHFITSEGHVHSLALTPHPPQALALGTANLLSGLQCIVIFMVQVLHGFCYIHLLFF